MSERLQVQTSEKKAELLKELVTEGHFKNVSHGLDEALTSLLREYGKLGAPHHHNKGEEKGVGATT